MQAVAGSCADMLIDHGIITEEERAMYHYGLEILISNCSFVFASLLIGIATGFLYEIGAYLLAFIPIRCCVGGYHASTPEKCLGISLLTIMVSISIGLQAWAYVLAPIILIVCLALISWLAPIIHPDHPHSAKRRQSLRKRALYIGFAEAALIAVALCLLPKIGMIMAVAFMSACLGMPLAIRNEQAC